jgi:hypothetical protein
MPAARGLKVGAFVEDADRSAVVSGIATVADNDQGFNNTGDNMRLPQGYEWLAYAYMWTEFSGFPLVRGTLSWPSKSQNPFIMNKGFALNYLNANTAYDFRRRPKRLSTGENITFTAVEDDEGGVSHTIALILVMTNSSRPINMGRPPLPVTHVHTVTVGATTADVWSSLALTEVNALPKGDYIYWGGRFQSATGICGRMVFDNIKDNPPILPVINEQEPTQPFSEFLGTSKYQFTIPDGLPSFEGLTHTAETPSEIEMYLTKIS